MEMKGLWPLVCGDDESVAPCAAVRPPLGEETEGEAAGQFRREGRTDRGKVMK